MAGWTFSHWADEAMNPATIANAFTLYAIANRFYFELST